MRIQLEPLRGFRDILPPESEELTSLANIFRNVARLHGYREVITPTLERFELFALKSGEEIRRSMYVFRDKAGREVALRPEVTASVARIYLKHLRGEPKPIRLYYVASCYRYEEPQFARYREFYQAGVELIGEDAPWGDIEVASLLYTFYRRINLNKHIVIVAGNTGLYRTLFAKANIPEDTQDTILHLMDKKEYDRALDIVRGYDAKLADILQVLWDIGDIDEDDKLEQAMKVVREYDENAVKHVTILKEFSNNLRELGANVKTDLAFARGLAYYTGIIFEVKVPGFPVSIAGGGRYDTLISLYGGENMPATGFAIGLDRTLIAMKQLGVRIPLESPTIRVAIALVDTRFYGYALRLQKHLVDNNIEVQVYVGKKLGKLLPRLASSGIRYALIIGRREAESHTVTLRDLEAHSQESIGFDELVDKLLSKTGEGAS